MRLALAHVVLLVGLAALPAISASAQGKTACDLISQADAEAIVGVPLLPPTPLAPYRSLLENKDFTWGKPGEACQFTNYAPPRRPPKVVAFTIQVRYSATPDPGAVADAKRQVDERTYDKPTDVAGLGDAAFWIGPPSNSTLFVFRGGTMRLMIGPSDIGREKLQALAVKALGGTPDRAANAPAATSSASIIYRSPRAFAKPALDPSPKASQIDELKRKLAGRADQGDLAAALALANLYRSATLAADGTPRPDHAGAAYWYELAAERGSAEAAFELGMLYRDGLGVAADPQSALELFRKAAEAGFVPAMVPLSLAYAAAKTPVSPQRATLWANKATQAGDPRGWFILGFEYNQGWLGGDPPYYYRAAMDAYQKAAAGGVCIAMMNIGAMHAKGEGVPQSEALAREWSTKGESCRAKTMDDLWERTAALRAKAAARVPAVSELERRLPAGGPRLSSAEKHFLAVVTVAFVAMAGFEATRGLFPTGDRPLPGSPEVDPVRDHVNRMNELQAIQELTRPMPRLRP